MGIISGKFDTEQLFPSVYDIQIYRRIYVFIKCIYSQTFVMSEVPSNQMIHLKMWIQTSNNGAETKAFFCKTRIPL